MLKDAPIIPYIPVSDLARARNFYQDVIYECGGSKAFMYVSGGAGTSKASQAFWSVKDIKAEVAELKSRGVQFEEYDMPGMKMENSIATAGGAMAAWFKDTEGNIMAIVQDI
jgi:predicted enzyme related to lactoylglutathione lyase